MEAARNSPSNDFFRRTRNGADAFFRSEAGSFGQIGEAGRSLSSSRRCCETQSSEDSLRAVDLAAPIHTTSPALSDEERS
jgi:hypothetical protein